MSAYTPTCDVESGDGQYLHTSFGNQTNQICNDRAKEKTFQEPDGANQILINIFECKNLDDVS